MYFFMYISIKTLKQWQNTAFNKRCCVSAVYNTDSNFVFKSLKCVFKWKLIDSSCKKDKGVRKDGREGERKEE